MLVALYYFLPMSVKRGFWSWLVETRPFQLAHTFGTSHRKKANMFAWLCYFREIHLGKMVQPDCNIYIYFFYGCFPKIMVPPYHALKNRVFHEINHPFWGTVPLFLETSIYLGTTPHPVTVTTRIITFLIGNPYKPSFVTVTGWGVDLKYI